MEFDGHRQTQYSHKRRLFAVIVVALLLLSAWHISSHEVSHEAVDTDGISEHTQCQLCRLSHLAATPSTPLVLVEALYSSYIVVPVQALQKTLVAYRYTLGARAPPLS